METIKLIDNAGVNRYDVLMAVRAGYTVHYVFASGDVMVIKEQVRTVNCLSVRFVSVAYKSLQQTEDANCETWITIGEELFHSVNDIKAVDCFVTRLICKDPSQSMGIGVDPASLRSIH